MVFRYFISFHFAIDDISAFRHYCHIFSAISFISHLHTADIDTLHVLILAFQSHLYTLLAEEGRLSDI